jgi:hypothetical protein
VKIARNAKMQSVEQIQSFDFTAGGTYSDNYVLQFITSTTKIEEI